MKAKPISLGLLLLLLFLIAATPSWASPVVLSPIRADNDGVHFGDLSTITNTIDKSGLFKNFDSGYTGWDSYFGTTLDQTTIEGKTHWTSQAGVADHSGNFALEWFSPYGILESNIVYDLGRTYAIDKIALWNDEAGGFGGIGMARVRFEYEDENSGDTVSYYWGELHPAKFSASYPAEIFDLGGEFMASRVYLDVFGVDGSNYVSMGEIAFSATHAPAPPAVFLLFSGLLGLASYRRFNR